MVLGLSTKNRKAASVQLDYLIHIHEVKPWPPSQSLRSLRSVLIQWENGERSTGSTNAVVPSLGTVIGEGKIEFNESFRLRVTLLRDMNARGKDSDIFLKNSLEFNLCEPRRDKIQLLATAVIDLADYGVISDTISLSAPMNSKRSFRNISEPVLYLKIQPVEKGHASSSLREGLSKEVSLEKNGGESVSTLMNEEYSEEAEVASFTDDDVSSHSSLANGSLPIQNEENGPHRVTGSKGCISREHDLASKPEIEKHMAQQEDLKRASSFSASTDLSSELGSPIKSHSSILNPVESSLISTLSSGVPHIVHSSAPTFTADGKGEDTNASMKSNGHQDLLEEDHLKVGSKITVTSDSHTNSTESRLNSSRINAEDHPKAQEASKTSLEENASDDDSQNLDEIKDSSEDESLDSCSQDPTRDKGFLGSDELSSKGETGMKGNIFKTDRLKHVKSVRSPSDSVRSNGSIGRNQHLEVKDIGALEVEPNVARNLRVNERKNAKVYPRDVRTTISDTKIQPLEHKIKMLEGELREAAAIEAALYSVVAEHGSSMSKVHAPARRLSRLYLHACKETFQSRKASAARSAVSGLVLVAKACGNDVPRLTFWLSNCVVLRAIISQENSDPDLKFSVKLPTESNGRVKGNTTMLSPLKWKESSPSRRENNSVVCRDSVDWKDQQAFTTALERIEAWIFSRIVESIWWQTLTPHMQSDATRAIDRFIDSGSKKNLGRTSSSGDQGQGNFSINLWKEAFKDACERLCPVRAGGHECGCLPMLARLVMEQCVARLDVAMFNAILREAADAIPSDPISDPISDLKVLPIPAGNSSFGAGAQLKNAIGNWSRWLTDLFGMDDDDGTLEDDNDKDDNDERQDTTFKSFHLLNALSDLMMLPKDMLLSRSIRKEVCPTLGAPLIKKVLDHFVPDEFCPDPIPDVVLEALDSEDNLEVGENMVASIPCIAAAPTYLPPSVASVAGTIGEFRSQPHLRRSGSSVLRKSYTSDDELDELNSPLASIILEGPPSSSAPTKPSRIWKGKGSSQNAIRYELLRDIWMNSE